MWRLGSHRETGKNPVGQEGDRETMNEHINKQEERR